MEAATQPPPPDFETHLQGLLSSLQAAKQSISTKTTNKPSKTKNTYYAAASPSSPNLSHLPLPPNLLYPLALRLIPSGTKPAKSRLTTHAMAFELSTPTALNQSIHFYFPTHISANLAMGLYPTFGEAVLLVAVPTVAKGGNGKGEKGEQITSIPIHGALSPTGAGGDVYVERIVKEAASGRLRGVVMYVDWRSESREFPQEMAPRPIRRAARRAGGEGFGRRVEAQFEIEDGDGDDEDDEDFGGVVRGRGGQNRTRAMQLDRAMDELREIAEWRAARPTFRQFLEAMPGFLEALEGPAPPGAFF